MHWKILLFTILLVNENGCRAGKAKGGGGGDAAGTPSLDTKKEVRDNVEIPPASLDASAPAVLLWTPEVPSFDKHSSFSSIYPMRCGGDVKIPLGTGDNAPCLPNANDIVEVKTKDELKAEYCMKVLICKPGKGSTMCDTQSMKLWFPYAKKLLSVDKVTDADASKFKVEEGEIIVNLDPGCVLSLSKTHSIRHRFQNKPPKIREMMKNYPGFYLQPTFHHERRLYKGGNNVFLGKAFWMGVNVLKSIDCNAQCDLGQVFHYKMVPNMPFYSKIWVDGSKCEWFKVCILGAPGAKTKKYYCNDKDLVNVFVRNAFVVMPGSQNGAPIRLVKRERKGSSKVYPTQIGFDYDGERFSIWSVGRERVASTKNVNHDGNIIFYFSNHNCLIKRYGIMHMGENNGKVLQIDKDKPIDDVSRGKGEFVTYAPAGEHPTLATLAPPPSTPNVSAVAPATTTQPRDIGEILEGGLGGKLGKRRTGWLIWAIFYGFFVGSLLAIVIFGLILYFGRRSFYADWYRGMYKRYGCDASGVTGGVTGSTFGATTTGATGASMMSTIGSTTAGTTGGGGSTMGTTGGGSTMGTTGTSAGDTTGGTTGGGTTGGGTTGNDMVTM
ncbi:unnamed protein product [Cylicocyclus nassatus]|uniref:Glycoprotein n=1 Tax=Cylicocyclus nassatus TaxID=53992 RepID=A0AA36GX32_CYLNA|nr:unnamed protein product [Cylicocyclus nassatus]